MADHLAPARILRRPLRPRGALHHPLGLLRHSPRGGGGAAYDFGWGRGRGQKAHGGVEMKRMPWHSQGSRGRQFPYRLISSVLDGKLANMTVLQRRFPDYDWPAFVAGVATYILVDTCLQKQLTPPTEVRP